MKSGRRWILVIGLVGLLGIVPSFAADDEKDGLEGSVEIAYRNLSVDGSQQKFDEDYDGLSSGTFLSNLSLNWMQSDSNVLDFARIDLTGLGGEPYERAALRVGRKDVYDLRLTRWKQDYRYNLFELIGDEDGHQWATEREVTDFGLRLFPWNDVTLVFEYQDAMRTGDSIFMKDVSRDVFLLEAPIDHAQKRYTFGADVRLGDVDLVFRQTRRHYSNQFENFTAGNAGLDLAGPTELDSYDWVQSERGSADLTTLKLHTPLGDRVDLTVGIYGTFLGEEELTSRVLTDATGTQFDGTPLLIADAFSDTDIEVDHMLADIDLSVFVADPVSLHFQYRTLDRDLRGVGLADLDGRSCVLTGAACSTDLECDAVTPGDTCELDPSAIATSVDYSIDTLTGLIELRPTRVLTLQAGYRTIDRTLDRDGFGSLRDQNFKSDGDSTLVLGVAWQATSWLKLNADYEDGELDQAFTAPTALESERTRVRASIKPRDGLRVDLALHDFETSNGSLPSRSWYGICAATGAVCSTDLACDAVTPGDTCNIAPFESVTTGTSWSASFWQRATERVDYLFRYAEQDVRSSTAVLFDGPGFGGPTAFAFGDTVFDNTNTQWTGQVNLRWGTPWRLYGRYGFSESDGHNRLLNDSPAGFSNDEPIEQEFTDAEVGATYTFPSGLFFGASLRDFDYDDDNNLLDYDGRSLILRGGVRF